MKKLKKNEGITLIALVITIIVLLILAGISIQGLTENGMFEKTTQAIEKSKYAGAIEKVQFAVAASYDESGKINDEYLKENINNIDGIDEEVQEIKYDLIIEVDGYEFLISEYGEIISKNKLMYNANLMKLKVGDYIKYDTGKEEGLVTFRVLYEATSSNGLQIISDKNIKNITLGSTIENQKRDAYNNGIETLNAVAEYYINSDYALDARCVGSVPEIDSTGMMIYKNTENVGPMQLSVNSTYSGSDNMKDIDTNYITDQTIMENNGLWITGEEYWVTSRNTKYYSISGTYVQDFYIRYVDTLGTISDGYIFRLLNDSRTRRLSTD